MVSITYPSTKMTLDQLADWLYAHHLNDGFWKNQSRVHFVTHSMGGLVARRYLGMFQNRIPTESIGRMVMMGPPNGGSEIADALHKIAPYRWFFGPAGLELTRAVQAQVTESPYYEIGVIAGNAGWLYPLSSLFFSGAHDGRVSVESTKLHAQQDHIIIRTSHTFMIYRPVVWKQILSFIQNGAFSHGT